jgi:hypothetical protein
MFKVTGTSKSNGKTKVRFANDMLRVKLMVKNGQTDVNLIELPKAMSKGDAVKFLMEQTQFTGEAREAIEAANEKYNGAKTVKVSGVSVKVKAKAKTKTTQAA